MRDNRAAALQNYPALARRLRAHRRAHRDPFISQSARDFALELAGERGLIDSPTAIARELMRHGYRTPNGGLRWTATQVKRELRRPDLDKLERSLAMPKVHTHRRKTNGARRRTPRPRVTEFRYASEWSMNGSLAVSEARERWFDKARDIYDGGGQAPPEPLFDSRGRVLKGRRFTRNGT